ncbi:AAA family ATPase [Serinicoccus hydrothermalis]|uniref:AAA family ATPase n=1 Tax=Serinicoccus hydrothermalis TaxID=1758689 RepID=UPI0009F5792D|nr:AAA family ATPase [Serinicoccus hydrothermalis]
MIDTSRYRITNIAIPDRTWIIPGLLEQGRYHLIYGDKGAGKSTFIAGHIIPEALSGGIERVVFVSPGEETTHVDLRLYAAAHGYDPDKVLYFNADPMRVPKRTIDWDESDNRKEWVLEDDDLAAVMQFYFPYDERGLSEIIKREGGFEFNAGDMIVNFDLLRLIESLTQDKVPTLYITEDIEGSLSPDRLKTYGGTDTVQNAAWKLLISDIQRALGQRDAFIDVTHTKKGDSSQIKGSTGRFDRARHAIRLNRHDDGGSRYTTVVGTGNASGQDWQRERIIGVRPVDEGDMLAAFGSATIKHRVPYVVYDGLGNKSDEQVARLLALDWSEPRTTAEVVVALGLRAEDASNKNDARMWDGARSALDNHTFVKEGRGRWSWPTAPDGEPS